MKQTYKTPEMKVYKLHARTAMLNGSPTSNLGDGNVTGGTSDQIKSNHSVSSMIWGENE